MVFAFLVWNRVWFDKEHVHWFFLLFWHWPGTFRPLQVMHCANGSQSLSRCVFVYSCEFFRGFFFPHRMLLFWPYFAGPVCLHTIGVYVSQPSLNWLLLCWVFLTGQRTSVFTCSADWWRRATTDILQCVNKRIFQQSICVVWFVCTSVIS